MSKTSKKFREVTESFKTPAWHLRPSLYDSLFFLILLLPRSLSLLLSSTSSFVVFFILFSYVFYVIFSFSLSFPYVNYPAKSYQEALFKLRYVFFRYFYVGIFGEYIFCRGDLPKVTKRRERAELRDRYRERKKKSEEQKK